jgi:alcohol dehydrogenase
MWQYYNPVKIIHTEHFISQLKELIPQNTKVMILCYNWFKQESTYQLIQNEMDNFHGFSDIEDNPSFESCDQAIQYGLKVNPQMIVAIGGGSVIDTAKAVRMALMTNSSSVEEMLSQNLNIERKIEMLVLPTTHGTASELTKWATIWNKKERRKYSLSNDKNFPDYAIYDHHFVGNLPLEISLITTLDALSHSFEALWNVNANPISDDYAIRAIGLILENIGKLNKNTSKETRQNLLMATMYSGLAFSNTKTAAAHSISYPMTIRFKIPHGIACSMTLYSLLRINSKVINHKIDRLLNYTKISSIDELWVKLINSINGKIKFSLQEYGISQDDITLLLEESFTKGRMDNNIVKLSREDVKKILLETGRF